MSDDPSSTLRVGDIIQALSLFDGVYYKCGIIRVSTTLIHLLMLEDYTCGSQATTWSRGRPWGDFKGDKNDISWWRESR